MSQITLPYTFSNGTTADATQVNANLTAITGVVNGNIDTTNINATVGIDVSLIKGITAVIGNPGSLTLPGGLIIKWSTTSCPGDGSSTVAVALAAAFPTGIFLVIPGVQNVFSSNPQGIGAHYDTPTAAGFNLTAFGASTNANVTVSWLAIGY